MVKRMQHSRPRNWCLSEIKHDFRLTIAAVDRNKWRSNFVSMMHSVWEAHASQHNGAALRDPLKVINDIPMSRTGVLGGLTIRSTWCRETPAFQSFDRSTNCRRTGAQKNQHKSDFIYHSTIDLERNEFHLVSNQLKNGKYNLILVDLTTFTEELSVHAPQKESARGCAASGFDLCGYCEILQ